MRGVHGGMLFLLRRMIDYTVNSIAITLACPVGSSDPATQSATRLAREWSAHLQVYRRGPAYVTDRKCLISYFEGISVSTAVRRADAAAAALALMFEESAKCTNWDSWGRLWVT